MRCISGRVFYVIVDLRPDSPTYGKYLHMELNGDDPTSILCPAGFGQGYLVLEDSVMSYKAAEVFYGEGDSGIMYDDPDIGIEWPFELIGGRDKLIISEKDLQLMSFKQYTQKMREQSKADEAEGQDVKSCSKEEDKASDQDETSRQED